MKAIIYYSLSGQTKKELEKRFTGDFYRIEGKIKIPKSYVLQILYLGMFASINSKLKYKPLEIDFDLYDEVILASPVWAFTIVPFMKKFLYLNPVKNKKVTLLITHEGAPGLALRSFKKRLHKSNTIIKTYNLKLGSAYLNSTIYRKKGRGSNEDIKN